MNNIFAKMAQTHIRHGLTTLIHTGRRKIVTAKLRLELGNTSSVKWFDGIGEYVIDWGPGYRVYLARDGDTLIILFGGGTKRGQQKDIDKAKALHHEYKVRKKAKSTASKIEKTKR
ncbi:hypothetical protein NTG1052_180059 [Candidatus Nitrotoga sp. 1052]|nr:hypothetical protein NTG1052_180059 [Candidatus Nitrotoga sp. 1052]